MIIVYYVIIFLLGLIVGSFLNSLQFRIETETTLGGRSFCPSCKHRLSWKDLFPIISWVLLKRKCRYCKARISIHYPLIETLTGIVFIAVVYKSETIPKIFNFETVTASITDDFLSILGDIFLLVITAIFILIALHDARTKYVYSKLAYTGSIIVLIYLTFLFLGQSIMTNIFFYLLPYLISGITFAGVFFAISYFTKGKYMGAGDAEIALMIGLFLGWPATIVAFFIAVYLGSLYGLIEIVKKRAKLKSEIPFGPFLVAGALLSYIFSDTLISIYVKIVLGY